jgi:hypothetical protein
MIGTKDILFIHADGETRKFPADCLTAANIHLEKHRDKIRAMHFGKTKTVFKAGVVSAQVECSREQVLDSI